MKVIAYITRAVLVLAVAGTLVPAIYAQDDSTQSSSPSTSSTPSSAPQQDSSQQSTSQADSSQQDSGAPPAATAPPQTSVENPPLSGLDQPQAEPAYGGRSYLVPGLQFSEAADTNPSGSTRNNNTVTEVSRGLGSLDLQKIWKRSQLGLDYIAGGVYYVGPRFSNLGRTYQVHTFAGDERILWRTGQMVIRDSFNYLPEGTFGFNSFGGAASFGSALGGGLSGAGAGSGVGGGLTGGIPTGNLGGGSFGSIGFQPRIGNSSIVDIVQQLSPRTSVTVAGAYDFTHFLTSASSQFPVINSQQASGQIGFNHIISRKDQIGVLYAYKEVHFPLAGTGTVKVDVWNALYGHRITGKLNLVLAGGPQVVTVSNPPGSAAFLAFGPTTRKVAGNGSVTFHYSVTARTNVQMLYQHFVTPGSGFFAGANTDAARLSLARILGRRWTATADGGYSHSSALQSSSTVGLNSNAYQFWYSGASLRRQLGQHFGAFISYQFNDFGSGHCNGSSTSSVCGQTVQQHVGVFGIDWHPSPIRLD